MMINLYLKNGGSETNQFQMVVGLPGHTYIDIEWNLAGAHSSEQNWG